MEREAIEGETVFLRVNEFKKGLIQFTDSTNAMRLVKEKGTDIRYNAAWKKWLVWNGKYWEIDEGLPKLQMWNMILKPIVRCGKSLSVKL